jgi:hypothetical protein
MILAGKVGDHKQLRDEHESKCDGEKSQESRKFDSASLPVSKSIFSELRLSDRGQLFQGRKHMKPNPTHRAQESPLTSEILHHGCDPLYVVVGRADELKYTF